MRYLLLLYLVFFAFTSSTNCNDKAAIQTTVLSFLAPGDCKTRKVCAVPCSKVEGCKNDLIYYDLSNFQKTAIERDAYKKVCIEKKYRSKGEDDFFEKFDDELNKIIKKKKPRSTKISQCLKKYISFLRDSKKVCKKKKGWEQEFENRLKEFNIEECSQMDNESLAIFEKIKKEFNSSFFRMTKADDRISKSKFCNCLNFINYLKSKGIKKRWLQTLDLNKTYQYKRLRLNMRKLSNRSKWECRKRCGKDIKNKKEKKLKEKEIEKENKKLKKSKKLYHSEMNAKQKLILKDLIKTMKSLLKIEKKKEKEDKKNLKRLKKNLKKNAKKLKASKKKISKKLKGKNGKNSKKLKRKNGKKSKNIKVKRFSLNQRKSIDVSTSNGITCINTSTSNVCIEKKDGVLNINLK